MFKLFVRDAETGEWVWVSTHRSYEAAEARGHGWLRRSAKYDAYKVEGKLIEMAECLNCGQSIDVIDGRWQHLATEDPYCESVDPHANNYDIAMPVW